MPSYRKLSRNAARNHLDFWEMETKDLWRAACSTLDLAVTRMELGQIREAYYDAVRASIYFGELRSRGEQTSLFPSTGYRPDPPMPE